MKKIIYLLLIWIVSNTITGQTVQKVDNIFNFKLLEIDFENNIFLSYNHDTSTVWLRELGFDVDSLIQHPPDTVNVLYRGICFLNVYQEGIEYPLHEAFQNNVWMNNPIMLELLEDNPDIDGWVIVRKEPSLFISVNLIRELIRIHNRL